MTRSVQDRLGRGWPFPVVPVASAGKALPFVSGADKVRQSVWLILQTEPGERLMLPGFGCGLAAYLMKPNTAATRAQMARDITRALDRWEPRIKLSDVTVEPGEDPSAVLISVRYTHVLDGRSDSLVVPFALE